MVRRPLLYAPGNQQLLLLQACGTGMYSIGVNANAGYLITRMFIKQAIFVCKSHLACAQRSSSAPRLAPQTPVEGLTIKPCECCHYYPTDHRTNNYPPQ